MRKHAILFFLTITALIITAAFVYNFFEIYERTTNKRPLRQARTNEYLAMERWLNQTGHTVRTVPRASASTILSAPEKTVVIFASRFNWQPDTYTMLESWLSNGGNLVICLDIEDKEFEPPGLADFLADLGIVVNYNKPDLWWRSYTTSDDFPTFSTLIDFTINHAKRRTNITANTDASGIIRTVRLPIRNGSITFSGIPVFMKSKNLDREKNAVLSWQLTAHQDKGKNGVLFVRGARIESGFFGRLAERGNFFPLFISVLVLIVVGLWQVIPVFGRLAEDAERPGKSMQERFLAEARFLKKYQKLEKYLEIYYLSLKQRFSRQYGEIIDDDAFFSRLAEICNLDKQDIAEALCPLQRRERNLTNREFIKHINTIETIMERI
ncbi:MAG: DUF4350 domain-containing protein [Spirochaetes bacterium]|nr:DUF4350 domain-containing protein [Spirochaetota bacterium]